VFEKEYLSIHPTRGWSLTSQLIDCLEQLPPKHGSLDGRILRMTFFLEVRDKADLRRKRRQASGILKEFFKNDLPPFSLIAQPPEAGLKIALYAESLSPDAEKAVVQYKLFGGFPYCSVQSGVHREIHGAGLTVGNRRQGTRNQATAAFQLMKSLLEKERMALGDIVRQWNFIEDILRLRPTPSGCRQNYQEFNDVRQRFYRESSFPAGFPAATGIGMSHGGVVLEFLAVSPSDGRRQVPLSNPLQKDAHRYSQEVLVGEPDQLGRPMASPLFERAKFLALDGSGVILISGTAAVRQEATAPAKDVETQTRITIENIMRLISKENLMNHGIDMRRELRPLSYLRAYVKRRRDLPAVKRICRRSFGPVPAQYVAADICRDDLLVELEGVVSLSGKSQPYGACS